MIEQLRAPHGDNYSYVVYDDRGGTALLVDPVAEQPVRSTLETLSLTPEYVVNTHGHGDHTSGNSRFLSGGTTLLAHPEESSRISGIDRTVEDGDTISVGDLSVDVLLTPGHTSGSICLTTPNGLVSGDTVFLAGCGNPKFGGSIPDLFESFHQKLRPLSGDLVLYPGHDYARRNLNFARSVDSENDRVTEKLDQVSSLNENTEPASTIGEEKSYNPFFRYDNEDVIRELSGLPDDPSDFDVFKRLRELRNQW